MRWAVAAGVAVAGLLGSGHACESCEHPERDVVLTRNVRRMQPESQNATSSPRAPLAWGQLNFLHTTDTHGWLEGHLKEKNYGADWGDFVSFVKDMRKKAKAYDVDLLVVDTGDLHDGAGLSDATSPNGELSNPIFENIDYDVLSIGNHELYVTDIAYETFRNFSKVYGDRYLTSNVQILNPDTSEYEYIGNTHRYFKTDKGLRIMAFGVLYDFTGNSNVSKVIPAATMVNQTWFQKALNDKSPVDLYLVIGHNPVRPTVSSSTMDTVFNAIRAVRPDVPIQMFGGHTHIRDFAVYDDKTTALESGRYCETLGWLSMSGFNTTSKFKGVTNPKGVANPTQKAVKVNGSSTATAALHTSTTPSNLRYSRRYLDWNRLTFEYHAAGSQIKAFDQKKGLAVSKEITATRKQLNLTSLYGCAPQTWCVSCAPFLSNGSIYSLLTEALSAVVINETRAAEPRIIILNTGSIRFDLPKGPFTYDDSFIVSPFDDAFQYIPDVPYNLASQVLGILNNGSFFAKRSLETRDFGFFNPSLEITDSCTDPAIAHDHGLQKRSVGKVIRRQNTGVTPGYVTNDDFGTDGDDTVHSKIPSYSYPDYFAANGSISTNASAPATVDLIFLDFIVGDVLKVLTSLGASYTTADVGYYLGKKFTTNSYLPLYAQTAPSWQADVPNCPVGQGVGFAS